MDQAQQGFVGDFVGAMQKIPAGAAGFAMRMEDFSPIGVIGDPRNARADWGRDLLDPKYERYVASPTFPVKDAP